MSALALSSSARSLATAGLDSTMARQPPPWRAPDRLVPAPTVPGKRCASARSPSSSSTRPTRTRSRPDRAPGWPQCGLPASKSSLASVSRKVERAHRWPAPSQRAAHRHAYERPSRRISARIWASRPDDNRSVRAAPSRSREGSTAAVAAGGAAADVTVRLDSRPAIARSLPRTSLSATFAHRVAQPWPRSPGTPTRFGSPRTARPHPTARTRHLQRHLSGVGMRRP